MRGRRVAWLRLTAAQARVNRREDRALLPYDVDPILAMLREQEASGVLPRYKGRTRRGPATYRAMHAHGWIPGIEM